MWGRAPKRQPVGPGQESVWDYPRPPAVVPSDELVRVVHAGHVLAESKRTLRVLETAHAPAYYIPAGDVDWSHLHEVSLRTVCEYKGVASYADLRLPGGPVVPQVCWWYPRPTGGYEDLVNAVCFYRSGWTCARSPGRRSRHCRAASTATGPPRGSPDRTKARRVPKAGNPGAQSPSLTLVGKTLAIVLPLALGAAVSPTLLTLQLLILAGVRDQKKRAWAMVLGCAVVLLAFMVVLVTLARGLEIGSEHQDAVERGVKIVAAVLLLLLGLRSLRHRHDPPKPRSEKLQEAKPRLFFGVGAGAMAGNASSLVLVLAATHITITSGLPDDQQLVLLAIVFVFTMLPVVVPALAATLMGKRADPVLKKANAFTTKYTHQINAGIAFFFAALLLYSAIR